MGFDCGFIEVMDMEDDLEPPPPPVDSWGAHHLKFKNGFSPEKRVRLAPRPPPTVIKNDTKV